MVDASPITEGAVQQPITVTYGRRYKVVEAEVTTDETVTVNGIGTLAAAYCAKKSDGTAVTCTVATTKITVTAAGLTDEPIVALAIGAAPT